MKIVSDLSVTTAPSRPRQLWDPGLLFHNGAQGAVYDPTQIANLFVDTAGTTPVTARST